MNLKIHMKQQKITYQQLIPLLYKQKKKINKKYHLTTKFSKIQELL